MELAHWNVPLAEWFQKILLYLAREKKLLDPVGIFISNLMHDSICDTDYAAMQTDLSKLQGEEEKRRFPLQNCLLQGNLLNLQRLRLTICLLKKFLKKPFVFFN